MTFSSVPLSFQPAPSLLLAPVLLPTLQLQGKTLKTAPGVCPFAPHHQEPQDYTDYIYMDAGIAPWESLQAIPKLDLGTPYPLNYSPGSSSCNLLEGCAA